MMMKVDTSIFCSLLLNKGSKVPDAVDEPASDGTQRTTAWPAAVS
jgi:hypothetical protein